MTRLSRITILTARAHSPNIKAQVASCRANGYEAIINTRITICLMDAAYRDDGISGRTPVRVLDNLAGVFIENTNKITLH